MNRIFYVLPLVALMACKEEKHLSCAPTFSGFRAVSAFADQQPLKTLTAGDSVIISAVQATKGDLIYDASYRWDVSFVSDDGTINEHKSQTFNGIIYDYDKSDPRLRLRLWDKPGTLSLHFEASYQYSSHNVNDNLPATVGPITTISAYMFATASGSWTYTVNK